MNLWQLAWRVAKHEPRSFWLGWLSFVVFFTLPAVSGYLLGRGFDALNEGETSTVYRYAALLGFVEILRMAVIHYAAITWTKSWVHMQTFLRANLLKAQMASGGPEAGQPVGSAGEALTHFRDDVEDVTWLIDGVVDVSAGLVFSVAAGIILGMADARAAAVLLLPMVGVVLVTRFADSRIKAYREADRTATGHVTGLVGDMMAAATTVKVNGAAENLLARLDRLVKRRGETAVRDRVLSEGVFAFSHGAADVGFGIVLIISAVGDRRRQLHRRHARPVRRLPRVAELPAADGRAPARPPQAGRRRLRPDAHAGRRDGRQQHGAPALPADRAVAAGRPPRRRAAGACATAALRGRRPVGPLPRRLRCRAGLVRRRPGQLHGGHRAGREQASRRCCGRSSVSDGTPTCPGWCAGTARRSTIPAPSSCPRTPRSCPRCPSSCPTR